jgi:hypothetical protein
LDLPSDEVVLVNPLQAEIHLVVRMHEPPILRQVAEQISTYNGASCTDFTFVGNPDDGCVDLQFARHAPPQYGGTAEPERKRRFHREHKASCHRYLPGTD